MCSNRTFSGLIAALAFLTIPTWSLAQETLVLAGGGFNTAQRAYADLTAVHPKHVTFGVQAGMTGVKLGAGVWVQPNPNSYGALAVRGVFVRTWGSPIGLRGDRSYVGAEVEGSVIFIPNFHVSVVWPTERRDAWDSAAVTFGVGFRIPINIGSVWMGAGS